MRFEPYRPTVAYTLLPLTRAVSIVCTVIPQDPLATIDVGLVR